MNAGLRIVSPRAISPSMSHRKALILHWEKVNELTFSPKSFKRVTPEVAPDAR